MRACAGANIKNFLRHGQLMQSFEVVKLEVEESSRCILLPVDDLQWAREIVSRRVPV